jgi:HEAT repeat protein
MDGHENRGFMDPLVALLGHPSNSLVEAAARALGHPTYAGAETSLKPLLESENQRLNYAAVYGLIGINSPRSRMILSEAAENHPNAKVRRMISALLSVANS